MARQLKDLSGMKFGMLTVIGRGEDYISPSGKRRPRWLCECECGNTALCQSGALKNGKAQSCGCRQRKLAGERASNSAGKPRIDIAGQRFGKLTAIKVVDSKLGDGCFWLCKCDCGNEISVNTRSLRSGNTKSCGCLKVENISQVNKSHGKSHTRLYNVWNGMRQRCNDKNHKSYNNYGGRGIKVCDEWNDFSVFESWAIANGYDINAKYGDCTIDRIDVNGNYEPINCRWVDEATQATNKRVSVH